MLIYNVTLKIDRSIHDDWVQWMKEKHIPDVMKTGCFVKSQFVRLLETDEMEGPTYAAQYFAETEADYKRYITLFSPALRLEVMDRWGNKFIAFRSLMQIVH